MMIRGSKQLPLLLLFWCIAISLLLSSSDAHPNNNNHNNNNYSSNNNNFHSFPQYSLNQHVSFDPNNEKLSVSAETEAMAFFNENIENQKKIRNQKYSDPSLSGLPSSSVTSFCSSLISSGSSVEDGAENSNTVAHDPNSSSFVSMECGFYHGVTPTSISNTKQTELDFLLDMELYDEESDEDSDDDDDDDDDDGHSMMLSNVSLRRSLALATGKSNDSQYDSSSFSNSKTYHENGHNRNENSHKSISRSSYSYSRFQQTNDISEIKLLLLKPKLHSFSFLKKKRHENQKAKDVSQTNKYDALFKNDRKRKANKNEKIFNTRGSTNALYLSIRGGGTGANTIQTSGNELIKRLVVAALVTLIYEASLGHLLEFVKIVMQTSPMGTTYIEVLRSITEEKGLIGIWDGFVPWGVIQSIFKGGVFGFARAMALSIFMPMVNDGTIPMILALTLAGGIAGGFQGYALSPTLLLKTRVMTNPVFREQMSLHRTTSLSLTIGMDVVSKEGIGALMKGSNIFAMKRVFDWSTRFYFSDIFSNLIKTCLGVETLTSKQKIAADLLGGTASTLATLPLDVLVSKLQDAKKAGVKVSAITLFKEELHERGWKGLCDSYLRGFEARLLHVCFTTVAMKTGTGIMYDILFQSQ